MGKNKLRHFVIIAILSALAIAVSFIEIPNPIAGTIPLNFDLSDLVIIVSVLIAGFIPGLIISVLRFIIRYALWSMPRHGVLTGLYAEGVALISSLLFIGLIFIAFKLLYRKNRLIFQCLINGSFIIVVYTLLMVILNFIFITPTFFSFYSSNYNFVLYPDFLKDQNYALFHGNSVSRYALEIFILYGPFNLIKGTISVIIGIIVGHRVLPLLARKEENEEIETIL
jgi:riboflavin transporter FmnP